MIQDFYQKFKKLRSFLGKEVWKLFWVSILLGMFLFAVEASFVFVFQGFLQAIGLVEKQQLTIPSWYPSSLEFSVGFLLLFGICRSIAYMTKTYLFAITANAFVRLQRTRTLEYGLLNAESLSSHQVMTVFTDKVVHAGAVLQSISQIILVCTSTIFFLAIGFHLAPQELTLGLVLLGICLIPLRMFKKKIYKSGDGLREEWELVSKVLIQGLRHHFLIKIYGLIDREINKAKKSLVSYEKHFRNYYFILSIKNYFPNIIGMFVICIITYVSIRFFHTQAITLVSFFYLFIRVAQGAGDINGALSEYNLYIASFKEIYQWNEKLNTQRNSKNELELSAPAASSQEQAGFESGVHIEVSDLSFSYENGPILFKKLDFSIKPGQVLLIKGESGVGKSTILMLLIGLLKPKSGSIKINQQQVSSVQKLLFERIAYVGSEPYMIAGTIKENLLFGHHNAQSVTEAEMLDALKKAQLTDGRFSLDYFINEQTPMSTGQKQRLAIARGVLRKPKLLILDEATANLDGGTEANFIRAIDGVLKEVTTIIISHKPSFDSVATQTIELKKQHKEIEA